MDIVQPQCEWGRVIVGPVRVLVPAFFLGLVWGQGPGQCGVNVGPGGAGALFHHWLHADISLTACPTAHAMQALSLVGGNGTHSG